MNEGALIRLMSWLSPVFPTGGFAYSAGLEQAVASGLVRTGEDLGDWLETQFRHGSIRNDGILLVAAFRASRDETALQKLSNLAGALAESAPRHQETMNQGHSFFEAVRHWPDMEKLPSGLALPVAIGAASSRSGIGLCECLQAFLNGFAINQLQVAIRLSVTGQNGAAKILSGLEHGITMCAGDLVHATLGELGSATFNTAIAGMQHETLEPRLFLS